VVLKKFSVNSQQLLLNNADTSEQQSIPDHTVLICARRKLALRQSVVPKNHGLKQLQPANVMTTVTINSHVSQLKKTYGLKDTMTVEKLNAVVE
jgi:hypothetical protein